MLLEEGSIVMESSEPIPETHNVLKMFWREILISIYAAGMLLVGLWVLIANLRLIRLIKRSKELGNGRSRVKVSDQISAPFSWWGKILLSPHDLDENMDMVIGHENIHIQKRHSIDLLMVQLFIVLEWYNPFAWLILNKLQLVHEFEVDSAVSPKDRYEYNMMLIKKVSQNNNLNIVNSLNSNLKIRIKMMKKKNSSPLRKLSVLVLLIAIGMSAYGLGSPTLEKVIDSVKPVADKTTETRSKAKKINIVPASHIAKSSKAGTLDSLIIVGYTTVKKNQDPIKLTNELISKEETGVFVDGKRFTGDVNSIDKNKIKSISVVKSDPRFPNGVIHIDLKDGDCATTSEKMDTIEVVGVGTIKKKHTPIRITNETIKKDNVIVFVDDQKYTGDINSIDPKKIESVTVIKSNAEFPDGAIYIKLKKGESADASLVEGLSTSNK